MRSIIKKIFWQFVALISSNAEHFVLTCSFKQLVPLAVCISVQGPARRGGRNLFCDTEDL